MKEFIYTCEHCGSEYNITAPGKYECSICNNTFIIEDLQQQEQLHFQEQQKKLEEIRQKTIEQKKTEKKTIEQKTTEKENQKKKPKRKGEIGEAILWTLFAISAIVTFASIVFAFIERTAILYVVIGLPSTITTYILFEFYRLLQAIEYNTRKEEK